MCLPSCGYSKSTFQPQKIPVNISENNESNLFSQSAYSLAKGEHRV